MRIDMGKNVWHCNYCQEGGGMLALYGKVHGLNNSDAYREIIETLMTDGVGPAYQTIAAPPARDMQAVAKASPQDLHRTYTAMLELLSLSPVHREHLRTVRGLTDEQIREFGFKSTPNPYLCRAIASRLAKQGCVIQGVPGFYVDDKGYWTVRFFSKTAGIIIPMRSIDGLICGIQTRLDHPIKDKNDPPGKAGIKYLSLSSDGKNMGTSCGSLVHFVGDPNASVVYVTEGGLKADVAHALTRRTFLATVGANNVAALDDIFACLKRNGTKEIIEAEDMDKYWNKAVQSGAMKVFLMARKHGLDCRRLTWSPRYKGIDDWQLALRRQENKPREELRMNFKQQYLNGCCDIEDLDEHIEKWHTMSEGGVTLPGYLGLSEQEYDLVQRGAIPQLTALLDRKRKRQRFRIYQIDMESASAIPYTFCGISKLHELGYEQPSAPDYRMVYDSAITCPIDLTSADILERLFQLFDLNYPNGFRGRSLSISDVVELYDDVQRSYYYRDTDHFEQIGFSPALTKPMEQTCTPKNQIS